MVWNQDNERSALSLLAQEPLLALSIILTSGVLSLTYPLTKSMPAKPGTPFFRKNCHTQDSHWWSPGIAAAHEIAVLLQMPTDSAKEQCSSCAPVPSVKWHSTPIGRKANYTCLQAHHGNSYFFLVKSELMKIVRKLPVWWPQTLQFIVVLWAKCDLYTAACVGGLPPPNIIKTALYVPNVSLYWFQSIWRFKSLAVSGVEWSSGIWTFFN